jgi:branched-chain amino acid transport system permease protein
MARVLTSLMMAGLAFVIAAILPQIAGSYATTFAFTLIVALILAQSWDWIGGQMGYMNLGHFAFYGIGAYAAAIAIAGGYPVPVAFMGAFVAAVASAALVAFPLFRLHGDYFAFATLSLLPLCQILAFNFDALTHGSNGIPLPPHYVLVPAYYTALLVAGIAFGVTLVIHKSRFGYALRAIRNDEQAAALAGINLLPMKIAVLVLSAGFAGIAGAIQTWQVGYLDPTTAFGLDVGLAPLAMVLLGGAGLLLGPLLGVLVLGTAHHLLLVKLTMLQTAVYGAVILLVGRFLPRGLLSILSPPDREAPANVPTEFARADVSRAAASLDLGAAAKRSDPAQGPMLRCRNVTMAFGGLKAVSDLSLEIPQGQIVGLVGPNGSGKTTLFNCISKVFEPTAGKIEFAGMDVAGLRQDQISRLGVGRTYQIPRPFSDLTVEENVTVPLLFRDTGTTFAAAAREARDIAAFAGLGNRLRWRADTLSLQEKKALEFARALACKPRLLLIDEVACGLTPTEVRRFIELLKQVRAAHGITIIWVEHIFWALAETVERLVVMENGAVLADGPLDAVVRDENVLRAYLGSAEREVA